VTLQPERGRYLLRGVSDGPDVQQLLWIETLVKAVSGLALLVLPGVAIRLLGLPPAQSVLWPRLLGAVLLGIAGAAFVEGAWSGSRGIGVAGLVLVNLSMAAALAITALSGAPAPTRRGRLLLWLVAAALFVGALIEIAYA